MSDNLSTYTFLPWLRIGITNNISTDEQDTSVKIRPSIQVDLQLKGDALAGGVINAQVNKKVDLFSPGDIIGIDPKAIVKVEPHNWITNFEPNYLPYIEFYDEDFPWHYPPSRP